MGIESISLFPYNKLWRASGQTELTNTFGGVASLFIYLLVGAIFMLKFVQAVQKNTVTTTENTQKSQFPPLVNFTTDPNTLTSKQSMIAINLNQINLSNSNPYSNSELKIEANYVVQDTNTKNITKLTLQTCTPSHFSQMDKFQTNYLQWGINNWICLPLNQTYQIGGSLTFSTIHKYIEMKASCLTTNCLSKNNSSSLFEIFTLNSYPNPDNTTNPWGYYINRKLALIQSNLYTYYQFHFNQDIIKTDNSILPYSQLSSQSGLDLDQNIRYAEAITQDPTMYMLFTSSIATITYNRSYYKILDAVSYVGGIFLSVISAFFFMESFGALAYQMKIASRHFRCKEANKFGILSYIKQVVFNVLKNTRFKPNWVIAENRIKIRQSVNKMLDILYLNRRIEYLEKALTILFEKHQLKGIHLLARLTLKQSDENYKMHKLRSRFFHFFNKNAKNVNDLKNPIIMNPHQSNPKKLIAQQQILQKTSKIQKNQSNKKSNPPLSNSLSISKQQMNTEDFFDREIQPSDFQLQEQDQPNEIEDEFIYEIETDLKRLIREGQKISGDKRSRLIYSRISQELKRKMKIAVQLCTQKANYCVPRSLLE